MLTLDQLATKYLIDQQKDNYPLNTIRLLYLILIETLATNPESANQTLLSALPLIREILDQRSQARLSGETKNLAKELEAIAAPLEKLQGLLPDVQLRQTLEHLFAYALPIQENVLFGIVSRAQSTEKIFSQPDVTATLNLRSMDSLLYSQIVCDLIKQPQYNLAIHYTINTVYQINDLIDAIIFAQEDTADNNFSAFEVIRKSAPDSQTAKQLIKGILSSTIASLEQATLPDATQALIKEYLEKLTQVLGENFLSETSSESLSPQPSDQAQ